MLGAYQMAQGNASVILVPIITVGINRVTGDFQKNVALLNTCFLCRTILKNLGDEDAAFAVVKIQKPAQLRIASHGKAATHPRKSFVGHLVGIIDKMFHHSGGNEIKEAGLGVVA